MIELSDKVSLIILLKISLAWAMETPLCGKLPQYNAPQLTHASVTHYWPWHAAIFYRRSNSGKDYQCGGSLISEYWILTAAHCVFQNGAPVNPDEISISLGRLNLTANESRTEQSFDVSEIIVHEKYLSTYWDNDIALVRLSYTATFNHFVKPICLWRSDETDSLHVIDKFGTVVGWGTTETHHLSEILQEAHFEVVTHVQCLESNREFYTVYLTERNFCAGLRNGTSVCEGDSGGSMTFVEDGVYYIRGIVSSSPSTKNHTFQQLNCDTMEYAIFTDVMMHLQWIDENVDCQTEFKCDGVLVDECSLYVSTERTNRMCKITSDKTPTNSTVKSLTIVSNTKSIPDLTDAIIKFENLESIRFRVENLNVVEKGRLTAFNGVKEIDFSSNHIVEVEADAFGGKGRTLSLRDNVLRKLHADAFKNLPHLEILDLNNNKIENLPADLFRNNKMLREVHLFGNYLMELHGDLFKGLGNLEIINLGTNRLRNIPQGLFRDNKQLQHIDLDLNFLTELPVDLLKGLRNVTLFRLSEIRSQALFRLPEDIFTDLDALTYLVLSETHLEILPSFCNNRKLKSINVNGNMLKELHSGTFTEADSLTELYLQGNKLESLPNGLFPNNEKLEKIQLTRNLLRELHVDTFIEVTALKVLHLADNKLEHLPAGLLRNNQQLEEIHLQQNILKELHVDTFEKLDNLTVLYLRENKLEILPQGIFRNNRKLQTIYLDRNLLKELHVDAFSGLHDLQKIDLSGNLLNEIYSDTFDGLVNIKVLSLPYIKLKKPLGLFLKNLKLQEIDLSGNLLNELYSDTFDGLVNIKVLSLPYKNLKNLSLGLFLNNLKLQLIDLSRNLLNELHSDTFDGLVNLEVIYLSKNKLTILPQGLFYNNRNLKLIYLTDNIINIIETDFTHLLNLQILDLSENDCIDESFESFTPRNFSLSYITEITDKFQTECSD